MKIKLKVSVMKFLRLKMKTKIVIMKNILKTKLFISNLINPTEHANVEENWSPRNDTNLTPVTFFFQTQQSQNLLTLSDVQNSPYSSLLPRIPVDKMNDELILKKNK